MKKPILCLDFDGVLHSYTSGWKGPDIIPDPPVPGMVEFLDKAIEVFDVQIFSSRSNQQGAYRTGIEAMQDFIWKALAYHFDCQFAMGDPRDFDRARTIRDAISYPTEKPAAFITIDDRAITFNGTWPTMEFLKNFKPWNK